MEKRRRSIAKAFSWRITATLITTLISYFIIGEIKLAITIGVIELFAKMFLYYCHERVWANIKYGLIKHMDYQI